MRPKKGGSVASNAVVAKVPTQSFDMLTKNFSNYTNAARCASHSGGCNCKAKCRGAHCKRGGDSDILSTVSKSVTNSFRNALKGSTGGFDVFKSVPAPAGFEYANLRGASAAAPRSGGACKACSRPRTGGNASLRNMSSYMSNSNTYTVKNRRGGAGSEAGAPSSLSYNVKAVAPSSDFSRGTPIDMDRYLASSNPSALPAMNKTAVYGGVTDSPHFFNYSGVKDPVFGGKRKAAKPKAAKPKAAKPKAAKKH